jgi:hypothetical protein
MSAKSRRIPTAGCKNSAQRISMTPRRLYRWKTFWLGVLVLAFLGWAWIRSMGYVDGIVWMRHGVMVSVGQAYGGFDFSWDPSRAPSGLQMFQPFHETITGPGERWLPKAVNWEYYDPRIIQVQVAYWLIILVFLFLWSAWLVLHGKRERRKAAL